MTADAATAGPGLRPLCAQHPELPSTGTCARCGRFACESCFQPSNGLCAECARRTADPLGVGGPFSVGRALAAGWKLFVAARWTALGVTVAAAISGAAVNALTVQVALSSDSVDWGRSAARMINGAEVLFLGTWLHGVLLAKLAAAARGEPLSAFQAVGRSTQAWPRMFWARLVTAVVFVLGFAALVIPGIYAATALYLAVPAAYLEPGAPAVQTSSELTRGRRWTVLALLLMTRGATLAAFGVQYLLIFWLFRVAELPAEQRSLAVSGSRIAIDLVRCALDSFEVALVLAAYLGLRHEATLRE